MEAGIVAKMQEILTYVNKNNQKQTRNDIDFKKSVDKDMRAVILHELKKQRKAGGW